MWRRTRQAVINCFIFLAKCGRSNSSIDGDFAEILDNLDDDINEPPEQIGPHLLLNASGAPEPYGLRREPFHHRPDAPWSRRPSPPEVIEKVRVALEEMRVTLNNSESDASMRINDAARKLLSLRAPLSDFNFVDNGNIDENDDEADANEWYTP